MSNKRQEILDWLEKNRRPEIRIQFKKAEVPLAVGVSKIGGCPDVPENFVWPRVKQAGFMDMQGRENMLRPLAFMAQFNLSETTDLDKENLLPKSGHLLFFYDYESLDGGENQDCLKVFYFPPETPLTQMSLPDDMDKDSRIPELQVSFQAGSNVPSSYGVCRHFQHKNFGEVYEILNDEDIARLWEEGRYGCSVTKLLGYADPIQDDMEEQCVLQTLGLDWDDYNNKPEVKAQVDKEKNDWILLFQLDEIDWGNKDWQNTPVDFSGLYEVGDKLPIVGRAFNNYIDEYKAALEQSGMQVIGESQKEKKSFLSSLMGGLFGGKDDTPDDKVEETVENEENDEMTYLCFGDGGCLYVFIRKQDLAAGRFDKVYFEVQSH
ncbi:MAG: DUF1963 domain-containing protein [Neisseriaceae bacterium]|nr:DUF1963 domain-containing protein [Neisseriaceae bacterium]MBO7555367.1 DUF1963 domain-containing protein [Neisseriaceae bacterium]